MAQLSQYRPVLTVATVVLVAVGYGFSQQPPHISIDEIQTGMQGYCLTVWEGSVIERFPLKVLSIIRNQRPGGDMIVVRVNDPRFETAGAIHGCSGSPVFIDGRLAGALAAGWDGSLEPLYLVRPIKEMLDVGTAGQPSASPLTWPTFTGDSIDLSEMANYYRDFATFSHVRPVARMPLATSLSESVCQDLADKFGRMGFSPLPSGMSAGGAADAADDTAIQPGGILAAVMCSGDIHLAAVGTATYIDGQTVYGFGHSFTGNGLVEFPMSAGKVHTIVATRSSSFKLASPGPVVGTIQFDQNAAIRGQIGVMPRQVPLRIVIDRFNDSTVRTWNCKIVYDRFFTPMVAQLVLAATAQMQGPFPTEHTLRYMGQIDVSEGTPIRFENISSDRSMADVATEVFATLGILMNNPFAEVSPTGIDVKITIEPTNATAALGSATLSQTIVKPGQTVTAEVTLESFRSAKSRQSILLTMPDNLPPGNYPLQLMGADAYAAFLRQTAPQRFRVVDAPTLIDGLNRLLDAPRNRLYAVLSVPATGLTLRRHTLGDLPPTRMNLLQDAKRAEPIEPFRKWVESSVAVDKIIAGAVQIELTIEQP